MKKTFIKESFLTIFATLFCLAASFGQTTITTGTITPSPACVGGNISVPYTTTGTVAPAVVFVAQLSDAAGVFSATPKEIGTSTTSPIQATIPADATAGGGYKIRVVSKLAAVIQITGSQSEAITIATTPPAPTVVTPVNYVQGNTAVALTATPNTNLLWYTAASGGTGATTITPSTGTPGTTSYWVSQKPGACESPRAKVDVVVTTCTPPAKPTVTTPVSYTVNDKANPLVATPSGGGTINWYGTNATGGTASSATPTPDTKTAGTTSYYVSQTIGTCESERAKIDVVVTACTPSAKPGVADVEFCLNGSTTTLTATGTNLKWYTSDGTALAAAPKPSSASAGVTSYFVTQRVPPGCESAKAEIKVTIRETPPPTATSPVEYCLNETATPLTATGSGLKWYMSPNGGTALTGTPTPVTTTAGTTRYYVSQTVNGCESVQRKEVAVIVKNFSTAPTVTATVNLCQNSSPAALTATGTGLKWYTSANGGTALAAAPVPVTTTVGTTSYYVSQTSAGLCEGPRAKIDVVIKDTPAAPAVTPLDYCVGEKPLPLTPSGAVYKWYNAPSGGTGTTTAPTPTATTAGTTSYYVTQSNNYGTLTCESPRAKLDVTVNATPAAVAPFSESFCQERSDKSYTFPTQASAGNTLKWYTAATGGTASTTTPSINLKEAKETTYYVTQSSAKGCESTTRVSQKVLVKPLPGLPGISQSLIEYCQFIAAKPLEATPSAKATLDWYGTNASGGSASPNAPTPSTAEGGTTSYYVGQTLAGCAGDRAKIDVKVNTTPKPATKTYLEYCQNEVAPVLDATGSILKWYRGANDTDFQGVPFTPFTEKVQDYSFYVTQTGSNGCESPKEEIKIHIKSLPSATISGNPTIDLGQTATINIKFTGDGPWIYILSSGLTDTTDQADHQVQVKPSTTTSYLLTEVSNACGKGTINGLAVVTVKVPTINSGSPSVSEICASKPFTVPFQQSGDFPAGNTFKLQVAKENVDAKFYTIASTATANSVSATFPDTTKGGTYFVRVISSGANPDFTVKGSVSSITINVSPLPVATLTGAQTILVGESANLKADITGKAPWTITLNNGTKDTLITANATPFNFKLAPKTTTIYAITKVTNGCGVGTGVGTARVQVDPILGVEPPAPADWAKVYPTVINGKCTVEVTGTISPKQAKIEVVDLNGRPRSTQVIKQQKTEVDFANYPSGLYLLRIQNGNLSTVQRVMKP